MIEDAPKHNPQKKVWENAGIFDTYHEARAKAELMKSETKIRRCGPAGTKFKIKRVVKMLGDG